MGRQESSPWRTQLCINVSRRARMSSLSTFNIKKHNADHQKLQLLKSLILWSLSSSEAVQAKIKESYKQSRHEDDLNQPLSVQPWGRDSLKRRYWLIEGLDDTHFRLYREGNPALKNVTWWSVAGTIPELQGIAEKLQEEKGTHAKKLSERIKNSIPRFEGGEEVCCLLRHLSICRLTRH